LTRSAPRPRTRPTIAPTPPERSLDTFTSHSRGRIDATPRFARVRARTHAEREITTTPIAEQRAPVVKIAMSPETQHKSPTQQVSWAPLEPHDVNTAQNLTALTQLRKTPGKKVQPGGSRSDASRRRQHQDPTITLI